MFADRTYEHILSEVLSAAPAEIDTRQGSIFYDAVAGTCLKIAQYYADLSTVFDLVFLTAAVGEYLDLRGNEVGLTRGAATPAWYAFTFSGTRPDIGERFFTDGKYFVLKSDGNGLYLEAEELGTVCNEILYGAPAIPMNNIAGLRAASFGALLKPGADIEDDDNYRRRIQEKLANPAQNGNRRHYRTWCEENPDVGRARIIPLWDGPNTVKGVIIGTDGRPAAQAVVNAVQEYVDPGGTGLGNGTANIGAYFTAVPADSLVINLSFTADIPDAETENLRAKTVDIATEKLKAFAFSQNEDASESLSVYYLLADIFALFPNANINMPRIVVSGVSSESTEVKNTQIAMLGQVVIN
jgi:uncharacterized phage protein gp47/JayE